MSDATPGRMGQANTKARAAMDGAGLADLPPRVKAIVDAQEAASERLIGWVQLVLVAVFAALYLIAPRPADAPTFMLREPVPLALAAYGVFTMARLVLAYRGPLHGFVVVSSIFVDMGLLLGLIWSFHAQYGQAAAFSLKVPTFIYVFVFIALRALRFDYRYVLAMGLAAATGWIVLVGLVLHNSGQDVVTRSFVDYVNGSRVLLGAEFDKVLTIILVAALLAYAVRRAHETLVTAVREQAAGREIRRFLSGGVADAIVRSEQAIEAGRAEERDAAIMMLDIRGFTGYSQSVPPRDVVDMLTSLHARLVPIIEAHGGVVDKFLGDGVMVTFGAVEPSRAPAADGMRALEAVMQEAARWQVALGGRAEMAPLQLNGALAAGPVVFATLGNADRLEYTVIGEAVNVAAKLEKHNKAEGSRALVSQATYFMAQQQGYDGSVVPAVGQHQRREACTIGGLNEPMDIVVIAR